MASDFLTEGEENHEFLTEPSRPLPMQQSDVEGNAQRMDYIMKQRIHSSHSSTIYTAANESNGGECVVKILAKRDILNHMRHQEVEREIRILSNISHPNVVELLDWFHDKSSIYLVFDRASHSVHDLITSNSISHPLAMAITREVAKGLGYLHLLNIIHRDIKPSNILLFPSNSRYRVKISDLGSSVHSVDPRQTVTGTVPYLAPEIILGEPYHTGVDVWALGVTIHEMTELVLPFDGKNRVEIFKQILTIKYKNEKFEIVEKLITKKEERFSIIQLLEII